MDANLYGLLDTIVKIGLAAIISSYSTYKITTLKYKRETKKEIFVRHMNSIEYISELAEEYFTNWTSFTSCLSGIYRKIDSKNIKVSQRQRDWIRERDANLVEARKSKRTAMSRLMLLGLDQIAQLLFDCSKIENDIRSIIIFDKKMLPLSEIKDYQNRMMEIKAKLYKDLSVYYKSDKILKI